METVITVENLSKKFRIGKLRQDGGTLRDLLGNLIKYPFTARRENEKTENLWALRDVSFEVKQGDTFGIIGNNGAGKSTLLKILSRIIKPSAGRAVLEGRVGSLLEIGTGFHPDLTGRENIFLNGAVLGMRRREVEKRFDEIVAFADLEKFLETPVKFYSSGMYARLAFAVAAHLEPEILIIDEVLAVGDAAFQAKCLGKMGKVAEGGRTVIFVSHNPAAMTELCKTGLYLKKGRIKAFGDMKDVMSQYKTDYDPIIAETETARNVNQVKEGETRFIEWSVINSSQKSHTAISRENTVFEFLLVHRQQTSNINFKFTIQDGDGKPIIVGSNILENSVNKISEGIYRLQWTCNLPLKPGFYQLIAEAFLAEDIILDAWYCKSQLEILPALDVSSAENSQGLINVPVSFDIKRD